MVYNQIPKSPHLNIIQASHNKEVILFCFVGVFCHLIGYSNYKVKTCINGTVLVKKKNPKYLGGRAKGSL